MDSASDPLEEAWKALREQWHDDDRHGAFVALAAQLGRLPDAAARYRALESDPTTTDRARAGKERIVAFAVAQLDALPRSSVEAAKRRGRLVIPFALLGFLVAMSYMMRVVTGRPAFVSWPVLALEVLIVALLPWRRFLR